MCKLRERDKEKRTLANTIKRIVNRASVLVQDENVYVFVNLSHSSHVYQYIHVLRDVFVPMIRAILRDQKNIRKLCVYVRKRDIF